MSLFGGTSGGFGAAPAPASGGFSFGGGATPASASPAPAALFGSSSTAGGFGTAGSTSSSTTSAPAPSVFGGAPPPAAAAPAAPLFGSSAPAPSTFGAPAAFGSGSMFGSSGTPAPAFGSQAPASGAFNFGSPAPAPSGSFFGGAQQQQQQQQQQPQPVVTIAGSMHYSSLPPHMKQAIDNMHEAIMRHKRTMLNVQSMGPRLLQKPEGIATSTPLHERIQSLKNCIDGLRNDMEQLEKSTEKQHKASEKAVVQAYMYAKWPVEAVAKHKGVRLVENFEEEKKTSSQDENAELYRKIRQALDEAMAEVDRIDRMPSPYLWDVLHNLEHRAAQLSEQVLSLQAQLEQSRFMTAALHANASSSSSTSVMVRDIVETQQVALQRLVYVLKQLHTEMERVRLRYRHYERGENVLEKAELAEIQRQRRLQEQIQMDLLRAAANTAPAMTTNAPTTATTPAPAPFSFGSSSTAAPAPMTTTTNLFGSTTTTTGTPAPATTTTPTNVFGSSTPAAATPAPAFGSASSSSSKKKSSSRSSGRLRR